MNVAAPIVATVDEVVSFMADHLDLIKLIFSAIKGGTPKDAIVAAVEQAKLAASDAMLRDELKGP